jgi:hypothetical protein
VGPDRFTAPGRGTSSVNQLVLPLGLGLVVQFDPKTGGYWLVTSKGNVYNFNAPWYGPEAGATLNGSIVGISSAS